MAQGQIKKPSSQLAKGHKAQNKQLSKGSMLSQPPIVHALEVGQALMILAKVFKAKNTTIRKGQVKQAV